MEQNELYHHGVLGMKWGRRKATNTTASDKHIHKMEQYRDKLVKKKLNLSENGYAMSNDKHHSQEMRSAMLKLGDSERYAAEKLKDIKITELTTKKDLKKAGESIAEKQFNSYVVLYGTDGSVSLVNPSTYKSKRSQQ